MCAYAARTWRILLAVLLMLSSGCYGPAPSQGGGQTRKIGERRTNTRDVALPQGYRIEVVAEGLTYPTAVTFDDQNRPCVVEAGYSYGEHFTKARLVRVESDRRLTLIAEGNNGPWTGAVFHAGAFYVAQGGAEERGRIVRVDRDGKIAPLIENIASQGDHHTNGPAIGPDGMLYFGVGTATNSGVVGTDNYKFGWLARAPEFHDVPPRNVKLTGINFTTEDPLTVDKNDKATTGAYLPFGRPSTPGQVIHGHPVGNGAIYKIPLEGGAPQLVAWGLRNPYGLCFGPDQQLYVTENSYDDRGSRPVWGTGDLLWRIVPGTWYGWPDFHAGEPLNNGDRFQPPGKEKPTFLLAEHPNPAPKPIAWFGVHSSANGIDFSRSQSFGHEGKAFVATFGDMAPEVGKVLGPVGYNVSVVDVQRGVVLPFAVNRGDRNGPASKLKTGGFERPISVRFDQTGEHLYVVDFGVVTVSDKGADPRPGTGVLWRISREVAK